MTRHGDGRLGAVIVGSGNIGTDLLVKLLGSSLLHVVAMVGIDPDSEGLARARRHGVRTTSDGVEGLLVMSGLGEIDLVFDATSASAHVRNAAMLQDTGVTMIDLTPAAIGPFCVPPVNLDELGDDVRNINMVTCGGQATVPVVAALAAVGAVHHAEIVASIASRSAGPGTRANIDEFTETTSRALVEVGGARSGKAIIVLNPAEPPMLMRDTVVALVEGGAVDDLRGSVVQMVEQVARYVPGYRLRQEVSIVDVPVDDPRRALAPTAGDRPLRHVTALLEVTGAGDHLPAYAGNLDIMTSAALRVGELLAGRRLGSRAATVTTS